MRTEYEDDKISTNTVSLGLRGNVFGTLGYGSKNFGICLLLLFRNLYGQRRGAKGKFRLTEKYTAAY
jgi:hypothetical protein